jgi:hypothetical protein
MMDCSFCVQREEEKRRVSKGVNGVLRSKDPDRSFNGRPYAVQPLRDTAARDVFCMRSDAYREQRQNVNRKHEQD